MIDKRAWECEQGEKKMVTIDEMYERLDSDYYKNKKPLNHHMFESEHHPPTQTYSVRASMCKKMVEEYNKEDVRILAEFQKDALEAVGLKGHPRAEKAYSLAWSDGHSSGLQEVFSHLMDIADVLVGD